jgi:uncharacterized protein (DUF885 family)
MAPLPCFLALLACLCLASAARADDEGERLRRLFDDRFERMLREFPSEAMERGDYRDADRLADEGLEAIERRHQDDRADLERWAAIDRSKLSGEDRTSYDVFGRSLALQVEGHRFRTFLAPIGGRFGPHQWIPQMGERVRFESAKDYEDYLQRLGQVPRAVDQVLERLAAGLAEKRVPPRVTLDGVPGQLDALLADGGPAALAEPFGRMPEHVPAEQGAALKARFESEALPAVRGALARLRAYVAETYLPGCREGVAASEWPDGAAWYQHALRVHTTTAKTAQEIHDLGLREVQRIRAEMAEVIARSDFLEKVPEAKELAPEGRFARFLRYLREDPRFYHQSAEALLAGYRDVCKRVDGWLPQAFRVLPRLPYGVKEIPAFMAPDQTTAYYVSGDIRNREAGWFFANTHALDQRPTYEMVPLALHEAVPGHHLQIALAQEIEGLPEFRKDARFTAYIEGWALYSERLGLEHGMYEDPYDDFGRLLYEMWRACRLVVDPGMHALGWSRERAIAYLRENTALSELNVETEIDRYIGWPGQATAYKIGELAIRDLRARAEIALGEAFDVRAFHDAVLGAGALPLDLLDARVQAWILAGGR